MPNHRYHNFKRRKHKKSRGTESVTIEAHALADVSYSASFSFNAVQIKASTFERVLRVSTIFELYRLNYLEATVLPSCTGPVTIGWLPGQTGGTLTGWTNQLVDSLQPSRVWYPNQTTPITLRVSRRQVCQSKPWLLVSNAAPDNQAGYFMIGGPGSTAVTAIVRLKASFTFCGPVYQDKPTLSLSEEKSNTPLSLMSQPLSQMNPISPRPAPPPSEATAGRGVTFHPG